MTLTDVIAWIAWILSATNSVVLVVMQLNDLKRRKAEENRRLRKHHGAMARRKLEIWTLDCETDPFAKGRERPMTFVWGADLKAHDRYERRRGQREFNRKNRDRLVREARERAKKEKL